MKDDDYFLDEILKTPTSKKKKKINCKDKGIRGENLLCKVFKKRFPNEAGFFRVVGSGNRWAQVEQLTEAAKETLVGDVSCPKNFRYSVEAKFGYDEIDMIRSLQKGNSQLDGFLEKTKKDANRVGKMPMLCWKKGNNIWLAFVQAPEPIDGAQYWIIYREWQAYPLDELLKLNDQFWFIQ